LGTVVQHPAEIEIFLFFTASSPAPVFTKLFNQGVKHKVDCTLPPAAKIKNIWSCISTVPYI
jgi:hypothetical protein